MAQKKGKAKAKPAKVVEKEVVVEEVKAEEAEELEPVESAPKAAKFEEPSDEELDELLDEEENLESEDSAEAVSAPVRDEAAMKEELGVQNNAPENRPKSSGEKYEPVPGPHGQFK
jgi:hypothetical protein